MVQPTHTTYHSLEYEVIQRPLICMKELPHPNLFQWVQSLLSHPLTKERKKRREKRVLTLNVQYILWSQSSGLRRKEFWSILEKLMVLRVRSSGAHPERFVKTLFGWLLSQSCFCVLVSRLIFGFSAIQEARFDAGKGRGDDQEDAHAQIKLCAQTPTPHLFFSNLVDPR